MTGLESYDRGMNLGVWCNQSQKETHSWFWKSGQEPMVGELTGPQGEPTTIILLSEHSIKIPPKFLFVYPQISTFSDLI